MPWNLTDIMRELGTNEQCVDFSEKHGLVLMEKKCSTHRTPMKIYFSSHYKYFGTFICIKASCRNKYGASGRRVSRLKGTLFEYKGIDLVHVYYLLYAYSQGWSYNQTIFEDPYRRQKLQRLSSKTIAYWYMNCREAVLVYTLEKQQEFTGMIGGPEKVVHIYESKLGKLKYNAGRHIEDHWVLGLREDGSDDLRLEVCSENIGTAEVLIPLIKKHIATGTTIHTDSWPAFDCLPEHGYTHKKVKKSDSDKTSAAEDGTPQKESQKRAVKRFCKTKHSENFPDLMIENLWKRNIMKHEKDAFNELMIAIKHVYKMN